MNSTTWVIEIKGGHEGVMKLKGRELDFCCTYIIVICNVFVWEQFKYLGITVKSTCKLNIYGMFSTYHYAGIQFQFIEVLIVIYLRIHIL